MNIAEPPSFIQMSEMNTKASCETYSNKSAGLHSLSLRIIFPWSDLIMFYFLTMHDT